MIGSSDLLPRQLQPLGAVLGCTFLCACMDPVLSNLVPPPPDIHQEVTEECVKLENSLEDGENPIEKLEVVFDQVQNYVIYLRTKKLIGQKKTK